MPASQVRLPWHGIDKLWATNPFLDRLPMHMHDMNAIIFSFIGEDRTEP